MEERRVLVDYSTVSRWAIRFLPLLEKVFRKYKRPVTAKHEKAAARRFFDKAMRDHVAPEKVTTDKSSVNKAAIEAINQNRDVSI